MNESVLRQRNAFRFDFEHCPLNSVDKAKLCRRLTGRKLLFVGDSLQGHLFLEFFMLVNESLRTNRGVCAHYTCLQQHICTDHVVGGVPMEMVRDDWLALPNGHDEKRDELGKKPLIHSNKWLKPLNGMISNRTVLIITAGSHYFDRRVQVHHLHAVAVSACTLSQSPCRSLRTPTAEALPASVAHANAAECCLPGCGACRSARKSRTSGHLSKCSPRSSQLHTGVRPVAASFRSGK